jgi:hypothetical protein
MAVQFQGEVGPFLDTVQQRQVPVQIFATVEYMAQQPPNAQLDQHVQNQTMQALRNVLGRKMASGELAFKDLGMGTWIRVLPEIIAATGLESQGIRIGNAQFHFGIDGHNPTTMQRPQQQQQPQQPHYEVEARFNVGGLNINASSDGGLDRRGLQNQLATKAKSQVTWWAIGCGILFIVGVGVLGLAFYIYRETKSAMSATTTTKAATASTWDGKSAFTCGGNDSFTLTGVTATLSTTAITATGNCTLTLVGVDIKAPTALDASGNAKINVTGGSLNGSTYAVKASANAKVNLTGTTVTGKTLASGAAKIIGP